jgi:hypothetical protein
LFWSSPELERKLAPFRDFHDENLVHRSLEGQTRTEASANAAGQQADVCNYRWEFHRSGLMTLPISA